MPTYLAKVGTCYRGELELTKKNYSLMTWKLHNGTEELSTIKDEPGSLNLRSDKYTGFDVELRSSV